MGVTVATVVCWSMISRARRDKPYSAARAGRAAFPIPLKQAGPQESEVHEQPDPELSGGNPAPRDVRQHGHARALSLAGA